jgi:hypothetical protein
LTFYVSPKMAALCRDAATSLGFETLPFQRMLRIVKVKNLLPLLLMLVFALSRIPGVLPQNFSAAYAIAFCGGLYFSGAMAWWLPLGTLAVTDVLLNAFFYHTTPITPYMLVNWLAFAVIVFVGRRFKPAMSWLKLVLGGLLGAILFYLITNTASWLSNPEYAKTLAGWIQALTRGLPGYPSTWEFFRNTLLSSGIFTGAFVAAMKLTAESPAEKVAGAKAEEEPESEPDEAPEEAKA